MVLIRSLLFLFLLSGCGTHVLISQKICLKNDYQLGEHKNENITQSFEKRHKTPFGNFKRYKFSVNQLLERQGECLPRKENVSIEIKDDLWATVGQFVPFFPTQVIKINLLKE